MSALIWGLLGLAGIIGLGHLAYLLAGLWLVRRPQPGPWTEQGPLPPLTLLRPIKAGVPGLSEKLAVLVAAMRPDDQLILGVDQGSADQAVCEDLAAACSQYSVVVVPCVAGRARNPKISKLLQMTPSARHAHWVLSDSEMIIDRAWLEGFRAEWAGSGAAVLTCGYRFTGAQSAPQQADVIGALLSLWPGVLLVRHFSALRLTLGACTGFRATDVEAVGGWAAFGEYLAEDYQIGAAIAARGETIRLANQVAVLEADPLDWPAWWRHQRRVAVTYRVCNPAGFAPMILTHGSTGALIWLGGGLAAGRWEIMAAGLVWSLARYGVAARLARALGFSRKGLGWTVWVHGWAESLCWLLAWIRPVIHWSGKRHLIRPGGRFEDQY